MQEKDVSRTLPESSPKEYQKPPLSNDAHIPCMPFSRCKRLRSSWEMQEGRSVQELALIFQDALDPKQTPLFAKTPFFWSDPLFVQNPWFNDYLGRDPWIRSFLQ